MKFRKDRIEEFLRILPADSQFALEYRNKTWQTDEDYKLISDCNVAAVTVDEPKLPPEVRLTSDIAYVRWHGRSKRMWYNYGYSREEISEWIPKSRRCRRASICMGILTTITTGMRQRLGVATLGQKEAKQHILDYWKGKAPTKVIKNP